MRSEALRSRSAERLQQAEALLSAAFERDGWSVEHPADRRADLVVRRQSAAYVVELKVAAEGRPDRLVPLLAQAVLEARSAATRGLRPLAVVAAPRIAPRAANQILRFAHEHAPGVAVGVLDFEGLQLFEGADLESLVAPLPHSPALASRPQAEIVHLFTDLNQWMLKVLLAPELPSQLLSAPRGDYRNASELARAAGVSVMTAYRLVELLKSEGFLHESEPCLRLVRRKALFSRWQASGQRSTHEEPQRFVLRADPLHQLDRLLKGQDRACLGLFAAARALDLGLVDGVPPFVYVERLPRASRSSWKELRPCRAGESPDLILRKPLAPQSVFRSMVQAGAVAASDVIQTWLDVSAHPARGEEQAEFIYDRVLRPVVEKGLLKVEGAAEFARCVNALRPWLANLVFAGGWAHRLHRDHALAQPPEYQPIRTLDADVAFSPEAPLTGSLETALTAAGFEEKLFGEQSPPVTKYTLGKEYGGFYVEFLVPLHGSGRKRSGEPDDTLSMAGITAQKLRHLDVLLLDPWTATVPAEPGHLDGPAEIRVPNAVSFIVQKLLIHPYRAPRKRAQDILYIHDTLELFGPSLADLHQLWNDKVAPALGPQTAKKGLAQGRELFAEVTDAIREAARIPQDRKLTPEDIRAACAQGLQAILDLPGE